MCHLGFGVPLYLLLRDSYYGRGACADDGSNGFLAHPFIGELLHYFPAFIPLGRRGGGESDR